MTETAGRVTEVGRDGLREAIASGGRVLVEFWAPWCVQCGPMAGVVERLAGTLPEDVSVLKVSVEDEAVADDYDVSSLPALQLYLDGSRATEITGFRRVPALGEALQRYLA